MEDDKKAEKQEKHLSGKKFNFIMVIEFPYNSWKGEHMEGENNYLEQMSEESVIKESASREPLEDRALKTAAQFMGREFLPLMGIEGTMKRSAPTEQIYLNLKEFLEDFNYEMEDGSWKHLEFESDRVTKEDLRRFRAYEAVISYQYKVEVTTYVVCSAKMENPLDSLTEGINTYRVRVVQMKNHNADTTIRQLEEKQKTEHLDRKELLMLLLTPLMRGRMKQPERIKKSLEILRHEQERMEKPELMQMQAVLYTLTMKFLTSEELIEVKEVMSMTILGEMLRQDGIEIGTEIGKELGIQAMVESLTGFRISKEETIGQLMEKFSLDRKKAESFYAKYAR